MNRRSNAPTDFAPTNVQTIRELGKGRAATARLVDATFAGGSTVRCVEKVFCPGKLTRLIYRLSFFAPFAYQFNRDAIFASFFRRRVAAAALRTANVDVGVAAPLYVRFDSAAPGWVLASEYVQGKGICPARPGEKDSEMQQIIAAMNQAKQTLVDAGLTGSGWQIDPRAMVSTANLLRCNGRYTIVDLESGIPAILVPKYLLQGLRNGSLPPFDDLDSSKLASGSLDQHEDVAALVRHSHAWKQSEFAPLRMICWKLRYRRLVQRLGRSLRTTWHFLSRPRYQTYVGRKYIRDAIRRWAIDQRIDQRESDRLMRQVDGGEVSSYARGMAFHLALKSLSPVIVPAKYGGAAAAVATGNAWFLLPWLILPITRTLISVLNYVISGCTIRHREAILVGMIPTFGSLAFPIQIFARRPELAAFLVRDISSRVGQRLPVYGGKDSRTEIALIEFADRVMARLGLVFSQSSGDENVSINAEATQMSHGEIRHADPAYHRAA